MVAVLVSLIIGVLIGWLWAHETVAKECMRLGKFYVGKRTFECTRIIEDSDK